MTNRGPDTIFKVYQTNTKPHYSKHVYSVKVLFEYEHPAISPGINTSVRQHENHSNHNIMVQS